MERASVTFACSHCGATFANRWRLRAHLLEHGVMAEAEWQAQAEPKSRVVAIPFELSGRHRAGRAPEPPPPNRLAEHRRRRRRTLAKRLVLAAAALLVVFLVASPALAYFTASATSTAKLTIGTWGNWLTFCPGASQATHYSSCGTAQLLPIASLDKQGNLSCDFGDLLPATTTSWPDVFRVTSSAPAALHVSFTPSGAIAPFIASVGFAADTSGGLLNSKQTRDVAVQLVLAKTVAPGTYAGTLTVAVVGGSESHTIPLTVTVLAKKPSPSPTPTPLLGLAPGSSQATHYSSCGTAQLQPIAALDKQGNLSCDFGDLLPATTTSWSDVFRVTSSAPAALKLSLKASGALAPFIASVGFAADKTGGLLNSKQTRDVAVQLVLAKTVAPGTYSGTLTVAVVGGSESHTVPLTVTVLAQKPSLTFCPGSSQATHYSSCGKAQLRPIASLDKQGNLSLDFGDALPATTTSWSDVFRVTSSAPAALKVSLKASGALAPFIASVGFGADKTGGLLNSKQTRDVAVQLAVPKTVTPGTYAGTLTVAVVGSSESHTIPMTITVLAQKPKQAKLFTLCAGLSRVLPSGSATPPPTPPTVACTHPNGVLALAFGQLPLAQTVQFSDCLRLASTATKAADVTLTLSGPAAKVVQHVGFWGGKSGVVYSGLTLKAGQTAQLAFQFDVASKALLGSQPGTLTVTAKLPDGSLQQSELAITLDVVDPPASPSPSPSPAVTPKVTSSPSVTPSASATASPSATPSTKPSPSVSPSPSASPAVTPSASPSAMLVVFLAPISLAGTGLTALKRRRRST